MEVARNLTVILFRAACKAMLYVYSQLFVCVIFAIVLICAYLLLRLVSFWTVNLYFKLMF